MVAESNDVDAVSEHSFGYVLGDSVAARRVFGVGDYEINPEAFFDVADVFGKNTPSRLRDDIAYEKHAH